MNAKRTISLAALALMTTLSLILTACTSANAEAVPQEGDFWTLSIVSTNDIHGYDDSLPQYATIIERARGYTQELARSRRRRYFPSWRFNDLKGIPEMEMLNLMGYDAHVIGNNDFKIPNDDGTIPAGDDQINAIIATAEAPVICANVTYKESGEYIDGVEPYIIKDINGVQVGIIGVTSTKPADRAYETDKIFADPYETVERCLKELEGKTDVNIILSHCGLAVDDSLAYIEGISAVIGADDHYTIIEPLYWIWEGEKSTPIVQHGGEENHCIARLDLIFQVIDGEFVLQDFSGEGYDTFLVPGDPEVQAVLDQYRAKTASAAPAA